MRKIQQKKILELLQTLNEAGPELRRLFLSGEVPAVIQLLSDCQEFAIQIGNYIESIEGEGTQTVRLIEKYCEELYTVSVEVGDGTIDKHFINRLEKCHARIVNSVNTELKPNRIEIAFISYKASMSDSIETIYFAAKADPNTDAYFIPVPYYEVNPGNTLGKMCYEGAEHYRADIEITDWRAYDMEARHPDLIFTFNPYDENNYVTRIHPNYYCRRLREHTDCLVYVPYFVAVKDLSEHFATTAGCIYANKVIVESEKIRDIYVRVFGKMFGTRFGKPEDKFLAIGSPKFDYVINARREDFKLPQEWARMIAGKKVILYNTTVTAILRGGDRYLKKLRHVLDVLHGRDDVILWWRPHPLSENTYASMRPGLLEEYRSVVDGYRQGGWGIYDDTADLHRSIAMSDGYLGDMSSLVALYRVTGKPMMGINVLWRPNNDEKPGTHDRCAYFFNMSLESEKVGWAYSTFFNALYRVDIASNTAEICYIGRGNWLFLSYIHALSLDARVLIIPYYSDKLIMYDKHSRAVTEIPLDPKYIVNDDNASGYKLGWAKIIGERVYMFGNPTGVLLEYDINKETIVYNTRIASSIVSLSKSRENNGANTALRLVRIDGECMWLCSHNHTTLIEYNTVSGECRKVGELNELCECENHCFDGDWIWVVPKGHKELLRWNYRAGSVERYSHFPDGLNGSIDKALFSGIVDLGDHLLLLPRYANMTVRFDKDTGLMTTADICKLPADDEGNIYKYDGAFRAGNSVFIFSRYDKAVFILDTVSMAVSKHSFLVSEMDSNRYIQAIYEQQSVLNKNVLIWESWLSKNPLEDYIKYMKCFNHESRDTYVCEAGGDSGARIYKHMRSLVSGQRGMG